LVCFESGGIRSTAKEKTMRKSLSIATLMAPGAPGAPG